MPRWVATAWSRLRRLPANGSTRRPLWSAVHIAIMALVAVLVTFAVGGALGLGQSIDRLGGLPAGLRIGLAVMTGAAVALTLFHFRQSSGADRGPAERFLAAAELLGSDKANIRSAGAQAMAQLADDWDAGRQTCIDALCRYIRMPYTPAGELSQDADTLRRNEIPMLEREVRHTILRIIGDRLRTEPIPGKTWHGHDFDFSEATIDGGDFSRARFTGGTVDFRGARFVEGDIDFSQARFAGARISFHGAIFDGGVAVFNRAEFSAGNTGFGTARLRSGALLFTGAKLTGGNLSFEDAEFTGVDVHFGADLTGGRVSFWGAHFAGGDITFLGATFASGCIDFTGARFTGADIRFSGATFAGTDICFFRATVAAGDIHFCYAEFTDGDIDFTDTRFTGEVCFRGTRFCGGSVDFQGAQFEGGTVDLRTVADWSCPPRFSDVDEPPQGLSVPVPGEPLPLDLDEVPL